MRLPLILAEEPIIASTGGFPRMAVSAGPLAAGLDAVGAGLATITQQELSVEREKHHQAQSDAALRQWSALSEQLGNLGTTLKQGARDQNGELIRGADGQPVQAPADWQTYATQFKSEAEKRAAAALKGAGGDPGVQRLLGNLYERWKVDAFPHAGAEANRMFLDAQRAEIDTQIPKRIEEITTLATTDPSRVERETALTEAWLTGKASVFGQDQMVKDLKTFRTGLAQNIVRRALDGDPNADWSAQRDKMTSAQITQMQEYQVTKKRAAEEEQKRKEAAADKNFNEVKAVIHGMDQAALNTGQMTDAYIQQIAEGKNEWYPDPSVARTMQKVQENPPEFGGGQTRAQIVMDAYYAGPRTLARVLTAREALQQGLANSDRRQPAVIEALKHLQVEEESAKSAARGERSTVAAERSANIADAKRAVEADRPAASGFMPSMMRRGEQNQAKADQAEAAQRAAQGENAKAVAESIRKRNEAKRQAVPPAVDKVLKLPGGNR